jgi:hypothetical protein
MIEEFYTYNLSAEMNIDLLQGWRSCGVVENDS